MKKVTLLYQLREIVVSIDCSGEETEYEALTRVFSKLCTYDTELKRRFASHYAVFHYFDEDKKKRLEISFCDVLPSDELEVTLRLRESPEKQVRIRIFRLNNFSKSKHILSNTQ
jgi:hypothetical protein